MYQWKFATLFPTILDICRIFCMFSFTYCSIKEIFHALVMAVRACATVKPSLRNSIREHSCFIDIVLCMVVYSHTLYVPYGLNVRERGNLVYPKSINDVRCLDNRLQRACSHVYFSFGKKPSFFLHFPLWWDFSCEIKDNRGKVKTTCQQWCLYFGIRPLLLLLFPSSVWTLSSTSSTARDGVAPTMCMPLHITLRCRLTWFWLNDLRSDCGPKYTIT